jgi:hypothetical protein
MKIKNSIFFLLALVVIGCNAPQHKSPHDPFRGLWKLYIIEYQDSTGTWQEHSWQKGGDSYILYDGLGHMAVQITPENYRNKQVKAPRTPIDSLTVEELRTDLKTYSSNYVYTANCVILEDEQIIEHHRLAHTYPFDWGVVAQRRFRFSGDTLILMPVEPQNPLRLKWIKQP